jgi:hypothetical protein
MILPVAAPLTAKKTVDGAGVTLRRAFGFSEVPSVDPFLLFDHFGSTNPAEYLKGFPWHPHRGIETVTYMISGEVEHGDSLGNRGVISSGDIQWMTAGSGIVHQEMPRRWKGLMQGFQLWVNLPGKKKMMDPRYRGITAGMVPVVEADGARVKVIAGTFDEIAGPVADLVVDVEYLDVSLEPHAVFTRPIKSGHRSFVYLFDGSATIGDSPDLCESGGGAVFAAQSGAVGIAAGKEAARFLLVSGAPLDEPVSWCGPIVMNTAEECTRAFREYEEGTFLKVKNVRGS